MIDPELVNGSGLVVLSLRPPWPAGLGRLSTSAARAVRGVAAGLNLTAPVQFAASASEWHALQGAAADVSLESADASSFYELRAAEDAVVEAAPPPHSRRLSLFRRGPPGAPSAAATLAPAVPLLGSMGGYFTLSEAQREMRRLVSAHPRWMRAAIVAGKTVQGRPIEYYCVTEGGFGCEAGGGGGGGRAPRPATLWTALVHSREPATLMCLVHAIRELLREAQAGVPSTLSLLSSRRILLLPVANPDGYAWNERKAPRGGGMKRKNGRSTCTPPDTEMDGVDLNRNFGYRYAYDSVGSSAKGCAEEYRGSSAFSEPETQAIRSIVAAFSPATILHWHGWGNDIAFPYSYDWRAPMPDSELAMYQEYAAEMSSSNRYAAGRAWESVGYTTNGEADDWGWGERRVVSLTIEVGSSRDGFWPPPSRILPIAQESVWPARYLALASGAHMQLDSLEISGVGEEGASGLISFTLQNNGLAPFTRPHVACVHASPPLSTLHPRPPDGGAAAAAAAGAWDIESPAKACTKFAPLAARTRHPLPGIFVAWSRSSSHLELTLTVQTSPAPLGGAARLGAPLGKAELEARDPESFVIRVLNQGATTRGCDEMCVCPPSRPEPNHFEYSHTCRQKVAPGTHCRVAKLARAGSNWASGVADEHFRYTASEWRKGGVCTVGTSKKDTLLAVYASCGRFGSLAPLGFANSENGRTATVSFACEQGKSYDLFWNAEYVPGRFAFTISEGCADAKVCARAGRFRSQMLRRGRYRSN